MTLIAYIGTNARGDQNRVYFSEVVKRAYALLGISVVWLREYSNEERYWEPEKNWTGATRNTDDLYVIADDDCVPGCVDFFDRAVAIMEANPEIGMLCPGKGKIGESYVLEERGDYDVVREAGNIRIVRAGVAKPFPMEKGREDMSFSLAIQNGGGLVAVFDAPFHHLGEGYSQQDL